MTRSKYDTKEAVKNKDTAALFGHLIVCNNQIHSFQQTAIKEYFEKKELDYETVRKVIAKALDAVTFERALSAFKAELPSVRTEIYFYLSVISAIDGFSDKTEKEFFKKLKSCSLLENAEAVESIAAKKAETERKRLKKENAKNRTGRKSRKSQNGEDNLFRISQKEYISALNKCRKVAKEDFKAIKPVCDNIIQKGGLFSEAINKELKSGKVFKEDSQKCLSMLAEEIGRVVENSEYYSAELDRKESAIEDFTIAFLGRTKSGKSTLRAVLTGEGAENIGVGSQRTTRVNDIYEWNHLRIIDTPGIAAGNDLNREDRSIAEKAIGEADVICNVCSSDGVDKEVRSFIVDIAKRNKPVIVLINYKQNLKNPEILEEFIEYPGEWNDETDPNSAMGYAERIRRETQECGVESLITYQPVFLLAALLSEDEKYQEYAKLLKDNSGVDEFLAGLKIIVFEQGSFLRSKTIVDDMISICYGWRNRISEPVNSVKVIHASLLTERDNLKKKLEKERNQFISNSVKAVENAYRTLATTYAREFADENYNLKKNLDSEFTKFCKRKKFEENINSEIQVYINTFQNNVQKVIDDIFDDINFDFSSDSSISGDLKNNFKIPLRELTRFTGTLISLVGGILLAFGVVGAIAGAIIIAVGTLFSIVSGFFSKKANRDKKKKDSLYQKINTAVNEQKQEKVEEIKKELEKNTKQAVEKIIEKYDSLISGVGYVADKGNGLLHDIDSDINELNMIFAKRIMSYISSEDKYWIEAVEREFGSNMKIFVSGSHNADTSKVKGLLNEQIKIVRMV